MKKMIKRSAVALLILSFASSSTAQFSTGPETLGYESAPWGCFNDIGYCNPC